MTTNEDRAQRIVGGVIDRLTTDKSGVPVATKITQALADAGLLMPNFPEPDQDGEYPAGEHYISREDGFIDIYRYPAVLVASLMPFEVDGLIAALAAANHAEQEQNNE